MSPGPPVDPVRDQRILVDAVRRRPGNRHRRVVVDHDAHRAGRRRRIAVVVGRLHQDPKKIVRSFSVSVPVDMVERPHQRERPRSVDASSAIVNTVGPAAPATAVIRFAAIV